MSSTLNYRKLMGCLVTCGILLVALVTSYQQDASENANSTVWAYNEHGGRLKSLFSGIVPDLDARASVLEADALGSASSCPCQNTPRSAVLSWIFPPTAYASSCGGSCGIHDMKFDQRMCSLVSCSWTYRFYYPDPQHVPWAQGCMQVGPACCDSIGGDCAEARLSKPVAWITRCRIGRRS